MSHRLLRRSYHASPPLERAIIGLGTNLGNRVSNIRAALTSITNFSKLHATSFLYETAPMYLQTQPSYLNAAIEIETHLSPLALLRALKSSETALGRTASPVRNAARVIDLDILTYGTHNVCDVKNHLTIPHPRISERAFALRPIVDLNPDAFVTDKGETAATCLERLPHSADGDVVRVFPVRDRVVKWDGVKLMGILNVTPDSFSDGGNFVRDHDLLHQANKFLNNQFHFLDVCYPPMQRSNKHAKRLF